MKISKSRKIRNIIGYTFQKQHDNADLWYKLSLSFYEVAIVLNDQKARLSNPLNMFLFNAAQSLELIFKAILVVKGNNFPKIHNLRKLCAEAEVILDEDQKITLDLLTENLLWLSKYPVPKSEAKWNDYQDNILEKHIVRFKFGNTYTSMANNKRFPTINNFKNIWEISLEKYERIIP